MFQTHKEKAEKIADIKRALDRVRTDLRPLLNSVEDLRDRVASLELDLSIARDGKVAEPVKELR